MTRNEFRALQVALNSLRDAGIRFSDAAEQAMLISTSFSPCDLCGGKGVWQDDLCPCQLPHDHADDEQRSSKGR